MLRLKLQSVTVSPWTGVLPSVGAANGFSTHWFPVFKSNLMAMELRPMLLRLSNNEDEVLCLIDYSYFFFDSFKQIIS